MTLLRATEYDASDPWKEHWQYVRQACPTPTWTIVGIERTHPQYGDVWEVYAEPGEVDEVLPTRRLAKRVNARANELPVALRLLGDELRRQYPRLVDQVDRLT